MLASLRAVLEGRGWASELPRGQTEQDPDGLDVGGEGETEEDSLVTASDTG